MPGPSSTSRGGGGGGGIAGPRRSAPLRGRRPTHARPSFCNPHQVSKNGALRTEIGGRSSCILTIANRSSNPLKKLMQLSTRKHRGMRYAENIVKKMVQKRSRVRIWLHSCQAAPRATTSVQRAPTRYGRETSAGMSPMKKAAELETVKKRGEKGGARGC